MGPQADCFCSQEWSVMFSNLPGMFFLNLCNVQKITSAILLQIFELYWDSGYIWLAPPSSVTTRQCSSELDTALAAPSVGDALIINCVPDDKMSRMTRCPG